MKINVKLFSNLRRYKEDIPTVGTPFEVEMNENTTVKDLVESINIPVDEIAIVMEKHTHRSLEYQLKDGMTISLFPLSGGG